MSLAQTTFVPSREEVMQWEVEWDNLYLGGMSVEDERLEELTVKIEDAWSARTPAINYDTMLAILDYFNPPPFITSYHYQSRKRSHESFRLHALFQLCGLSREWVDPCRRRLYHDIHDTRGVEEILTTLESNPSLRPLVRRVILRADLVTDCLHLLPNVTVTKISNSSTAEVSSQKILPVKRLHDLTLSNGTGFSPDEWRDGHIAWPELRRLVIYRQLPLWWGAFKYSDLPHAGSFSSLRVFELYRIGLNTSPLGLLAIPRIQHNTLHTLKMHAVTMLNPAVFKDLLANHSQSLLHLEIVNCKKFRLNDEPDPFVTIAEMKLSTLLCYGNWFDLSSNPMLLPTSLTDITIGWGRRTPELALAFVGQQASSPSKCLRFLKFQEVGSGEGRAWKAVRRLGKSHGIYVDPGR